MHIILDTAHNNSYVQYMGGSVDISRFFCSTLAYDDLIGRSNT